jgi:hypothetical protein
MKPICRIKLMQNKDGGVNLKMKTRGISNSHHKEVTKFSVKMTVPQMNK